MNGVSNRLDVSATSSSTRAVERLTALIGFDSTSHRSNGAITDFVANDLAAMDFTIERTTYVDAAGETKHNLVAKRDPFGASKDAIGVAYFAHTDVVPAGNWTGPGGDPFAAVMMNDRIYGRGACDMKGSLATMLAAVSMVSPAEQRAPIWIACTADEETHLRGAQELARSSSAFQELAARDPVAIVGEPTRLNVVHGHKGIVGVEFHSYGRAAHSSTSDGVNANVAMVPLLQKLLELHNRCESDPSLHDDAFEPATLNWNFGFHDDTKAVNVVPDHSTAWVTMRPMPQVMGDDILAELKQRSQELGLEMKWMGGCPPLWTDPSSALVQAMCTVAAPYNSCRGSGTVGYATDGAVLTSLTKRIVCGPGDISQAHTNDEFIELDQLDRGTRCYADVLRRFACMAT